MNIINCTNLIVLGRQYSIRAIDPPGAFLVFDGWNLFDIWLQSLTHIVHVY